MVQVPVPFWAVATTWHRIMIRAFDAPKVHPELKEAIPLVFSHGCSVSRMFYSTAAIELASYGYVVFLPDHHDGSCAYTRTKSGKEVLFSCGDMIHEEFSIRLQIRV